MSKIKIKKIDEVASNLNNFIVAKVALSAEKLAVVCMIEDGDARDHALLFDKLHELAFRDYEN